MSRTLSYISKTSDQPRSEEHLLISSELEQDCSMDRRDLSLSCNGSALSELIDDKMQSRRRTLLLVGLLRDECDLKSQDEERSRCSNLPGTDQERSHSQCRNLPEQERSHPQCRNLPGIEQERSHSQCHNLPGIGQERSHSQCHNLPDIEQEISHSQCSNLPDIEKERSHSQCHNLPDIEQEGSQSQCHNLPDNEQEGSQSQCHNLPDNEHERSHSQFSNLPGVEEEISQGNNLPGMEVVVKMEPVASAFDASIADNEGCPESDGSISNSQTCTNWILKIKIGNMNKINTPIAKDGAANSESDKGEFCCTDCGAKFSWRGNLFRHIKSVHHNGQVFSCQLCSKNFRRSDSLQRHMKTGHGKKMPQNQFSCRESFETASDLVFKTLLNKTNDTADATDKKRLANDSSLPNKATSSGMDQKRSLSQYSNLPGMELMEAVVKIKPVDSAFGASLADNGGCPESDGSISKSQTCTSQILNIKIVNNKINASMAKGGTANFEPDTGEFCCTHCGKTFVWRRSFRRHINSVHGNLQVFSCQLCSTYFKRRDALQVHMVSKHAKHMLHSCFSCGESFKTASDLVSHCMSVHKRRRTRGERALGQEAAKSCHVPTDECKTLLNKRKNKADTTNKKRLANDSSLPNQATSPSKVPEDSGNDAVNFSGSGTSLLHDRSLPHNDTDSVPGIEETRRQQDGKLTSSQIRPVVPLPAESGCREEQLHKCGLCGKTFLWLRSFRRHQAATHSSESRVVCTICKKTFQRFDLFQKHMRKVHDGTVTRECEECGAKFSSQSDLKAHRQTIHKGKELYNCSLCKRKYSYQSSLSTHKRLSHM